MCAAYAVRLQHECEAAFVLQARGAPSRLRCVADSRYRCSVDGGVVQDAIRIQFGELAKEASESSASTTFSSKELFVITGAVWLRTNSEESRQVLSALTYSLKY